VIYIKDKTMTTKNDKGTKITTPVFRVSFPAVFQPRENNMGGESKYSITMLFEPSKDPVVAKGLETMKAAVAAAATEKWGADKAKWPKGMRSPFRKGEEKDYDGYGPGVVFCSATSKQRPGLVDAAVQPIIEPSEFYGGCYARATINAYAYDRNGNRGVAFGLHNIQKVKDGESFSGKSAPEKDFTPLDTGTAGGESKAEDVKSVEEDPLGF
jgi:hypothetical protein